MLALRQFVLQLI
ncbi:hypothetical protein YPPY34_2733, partial [Yersinia pestis PY-34]